jgi:non-haem Fe2+, alpha-ketoglutarate-dependent halogenase
MNDYDINTDMMRGFEPVDAILERQPLGGINAWKLQLMKAFFAALKYSYSPIRKMASGSVDITAGMESKRGQEMLIRGTRRQETHGEFYLSESEVSTFRKDGILGPFPLLSQEQASDLKDKVYALQATDFDGVMLFGNAQARNALKRHGMWNVNYSGMYQALRYQVLWDVLAAREITQRMASLLGDDLLCWRSQFFEKAPGSPGTFWHQTGTFRESSEKPKLSPTVPTDESMVQLTAWVALTDVTIDNGCMRFVPGSYRDGRYEYLTYQMKRYAASYLMTLPLEKIEKLVHAAKFTAGNFIKVQAAYEMILDQVPDLFEGFATRSMEMKAGEFIIFTSLNTHASHPNTTTGDTRLALAGRYTTPDVKVYDGFRKDVCATPEGEIPFDVTHCACMQVLGKDAYGYNRIATRPGKAATG